jgi:predicted RNA-binding protein YlqC (UPF0109 family)
MKDLVRFLAEGLVDDPDRVEIREVAGDKSSVIEVRVAPDDRGKLIGKDGRTVRAVRVLVNAAASRTRKRFTVEVLD